ncbi:mediator of DNA damage checkpoint protein 1-like isoform X3 [Astyanax mexicanus]|uniref:mediator of DNA damage checkpoint protein 1-like isoform X3 n=1 Tax=Astyanax mexicanus TaxID=7994 RepID=UPI0020CB05C8|nr:mediator of DNA damage checkpoint protein 1-like isoform X3 [Astyanax mexicanus]
MPTLCLFALRDILPGEEINYNYGDSDWPWRKQVKPEASTAKTLQKPLITTGEENYPVKCAKRALTASRVQEKREAPRKSFTIMESEEQGEHSVCCIQKSPETDCSSCPVIDEDSSQDKPLGAAENQEQGEHSVSCIQKSPETDCSSCPVIDEDSSQDKPLGAAENQEQGEHSVSCIQKSPETDCSSCPVIDEDSSQDKPLGAAENQCGTAEHVPRTDMKQSALEKHREMLLLQRAELSCEISKIDKLLDSPSPGADSRGSNSLLGTEDLEEIIPSPAPVKSSSRKRSRNSTGCEPRKHQVSYPQTLLVFSNYFLYSFM